MTFKPINKAKTEEHRPSEAAEAEVPPAVYTIVEFCKAYRISEGMYFKMRDAGLGPREIRVGRR
jgi:hypothetical protein